MLPQVFDGYRVRITPDGRFCASDVLAAIGQKDASHTWRNLKAQYPELGEEASRYSFGNRGKPPEVLTEKGLLKLLMVTGGPRAAKFREWAAQTLQRVARADPTLAAEIIDRTENVHDAKWLARRAQHKASSLTLNGALKAHGASKKGFSLVHDTLNVSVTGCTAQQVRRVRGKSRYVTKDNFSEQELTVHALLQYATTNALDDNGAQGDGACMSCALEVVNDFSPMLRKYFGPRKYPYGGVVQVDI